MNNINWSALYSDTNAIELKSKKDNLYDMVIGELNRISVSDDLEEKAYLLSCLKKQIIYYYDTCVEFTKLTYNYYEGDK